MALLNRCRIRSYSNYMNKKLNLLKSDCDHLVDRVDQFLSVWTKSKSTSKTKQACK